MEITKEFAEHLRELREKKGLTRIALAKKLGIPVTTLAGYEADGRDPKIATLIRIADFFGVSIDELVRPVQVDVTGEVEATIVIGGKERKVKLNVDELEKTPKEEQVLKFL